LLRKVSYLFDSPKGQLCGLNNFAERYVDRKAFWYYVYENVTGNDTGTLKKIL